MKKINWMGGIVLASLVALAGPGCGKQEAVVPQAPTFDGVKVDMPKLQQAFSANTNHDVQRTIAAVSTGVRYRKPMDALMALDKLANDPTATEAQKKVVAEVIDEVKQLADKPAPQ